MRVRRSTIPLALHTGYHRRDLNHELAIVFWFSGAHQTNLQTYDTDMKIWTGVTSCV